MEKKTTYEVHLPPENDAISSESIISFTASAGGLGLNQIRFLSF